MTTMTILALVCCVISIVLAWHVPGLFYRWAIESGKENPHVWALCGVATVITINLWAWFIVRITT